MTSRTLALLLVVTAGCVNAEAARRFRALPPAEQKAWDDCYMVVRGRSCSEGAHGVYGDVCMRDLAERYSALETPVARRETLVQLGCPAPVVDAALAAR